MSRLISVWRLQDHRGVGVWNSYANFRALRDIEKRLGSNGAYTRHDPNQHPGPTDEQSHMADSVPLFDVRYGCQSLKQIRMWFSPEYRRTLVRVAKSTKLCHFQVPVEHTIKGNRQVVFDRRQAKLIERRSPDFDCEKRK